MWIRRQTGLESNPVKRYKAGNSTYLRTAVRPFVRGPAGVAVTDLSGPVLRLIAGGVRSADLKGPTERPFEWTVELAEDTVRRAKENGRIFLRALIDEGGTATADRLREITGMEALQHATQTLSMAASEGPKAKFGDEGRRRRQIFDPLARPVTIGGCPLDAA